MNMSESLQKTLIGNEFYRFSVGDTYDLRFTNCTLSAHKISITDQELLLKSITNNQPWIDDIADPIDTAISALLCATRGSKVVLVATTQDSSLKLTFENGISITCRTDAEIVDWQWAITTNGGDPHLGYIYAVFWRSDGIESTQQQGNSGGRLRRR